MSDEDVVFSSHASIVPEEERKARGKREKSGNFYSIDQRTRAIPITRKISTIMIQSTNSRMLQDSMI